MLHDPTGIVRNHARNFGDKPRSPEQADKFARTPARHGTCLKRSVVLITSGGELEKASRALYRERRATT
jgi:hypothetical protein